MDARRMAEGVGANNGFIRLHRHACQLADQSACLMDLSRIYIGGVIEQVFSRAQRHHNLFHGGIAGALSDAVDGALNLTHAAVENSQTVGYSQTEGVVAVHADHSLANVRYVLEYALD